MSDVEEGTMRVITAAGDQVSVDGEVTTKDLEVILNRLRHVVDTCKLVENEVEKIRLRLIVGLQPTCPAYYYSKQMQTIAESLRRESSALNEHVFGGDWVPDDED